MNPTPAELVAFAQSEIDRVLSAYPKGKPPRDFKRVCESFKGGLCNRAVCKQCVRIHDLAGLMTSDELCQCDGKLCPRAHEADFADPARWLKANSMLSRPFEVRQMVELQGKDIQTQLTQLREEASNWLKAKRTEASRKAGVLATLERQIATRADERAPPAPLVPAIPTGRRGVLPDHKEYFEARITSYSDMVAGLMSRDTKYLIYGAPEACITWDVPCLPSLNLPLPKHNIYLRGSTGAIRDMVAFLRAHCPETCPGRVEILASSFAQQAEIFKCVNTRTVGINLPVIVQED